MDSHTTNRIHFIYPNNPIIQSHMLPIQPMTMSNHVSSTGSGGVGMGRGNACGLTGVTGVTCAICWGGVIGAGAAAVTGGASAATGGVATVIGKSVEAGSGIELTVSASCRY